MAIHPPLRVAIYARYSSELQRAESIDDQIEVCRRYAAERGWQVVMVYADRAQSGGSAFRVDYQRLLRDLDGKIFDVVVCEALDRLGRKLADVANLFDRMTFAAVKLHAAASGEITAMHIGLLGTMGQLYLADLREKTWRGLLGRARAGRQPGGLAYGYSVVVDASDAGKRRINEIEAAVVRRIFAMFAAGHGPRAIARTLNAEGIPGPGGRPWGDTTIRGQPDRGTGILNNTSYIGRLVWNRTAYVKDPRTGKRVARPNPPDRHETIELPDLRIVDDDLWQRVKARQEELAFTVARDPSGNPLNRTHRRRFLLSGLLRCGCCDGPVAVLGADVLGCANRRSKGTCENAQRIPRQAIEGRVLAALKDRMLTPDLVEAFVRAFQEEVNRIARDEGAARAGLERDREAVAGKIAAVIRAIEGGAWNDSLKERLESLERRKREIAASLAAATPPTPLRIHPKLPELYREKIACLGEALAGDDTRQEAIAILQPLIERVVLTPDASAPDGCRAELHGDLAQILGWASGAPIGGRSRQPQTATRPPSGGGRELSVVAGRGFEPLTFRL